MKRLVIVAMLAATSACRTESEAARGPAPTDFYGELSRHGAWVSLPPYGAVWQPAAAVVGPDFYPYYSGGSWVNTSYGWSWQSEWSWGWIPFHHGRWVVADAYGWVWVPGDEWAPAWVEWRVGGGNVGWVPLGPQGVTTVFVNYHPRWVFVPLARFGSPHFQQARLPAYQEYSAYHAATAIPFERGDWRRGPSAELVRRAGGDARALPPAPPRTLRPGDVRSERRVGPSALPPAPPLQSQGRRPPPPPGAPIPREPAFRRVPPAPGAPMPPGAPPMGEVRRMPPPPGAPAPAAPPMMRPPPPGGQPPPGQIPPPSNQARRRTLPRR